MPWDGGGSHDEKPGNAGYTREGHAAAHRHGTSGASDPAASILGQTKTILHRTLFLGPVAGGLGVGGIAQSPTGGSGYAVVGGDKPAVAAIRDIIVVPATGQRGVPRTCKGGRPRPDRDPAFYQKTRAYPISVSSGDVRITRSSIEVFVRKGKKRTPVEGIQLSPEKPVSKTRATNGD